MREQKDRTVIRGRMKTELAVDSHYVNNEMGVLIIGVGIMGRSHVYLSERGAIRPRNALNALLQAPRDTISPIQPRRRRRRKESR